MKVVVGCILDFAGSVLITQRPLHTSHPGFWEFPGGKVEPGESPLQALKREIFEEIGLRFTEAHFLTEIETPGQMTLHVYIIEDFEGKPLCLEGQTGLEWIRLNEHLLYSFPAANAEIFPMLQHYISAKQMTQ